MELIALTRRIMRMLQTEGAYRTEAQIMPFARAISDAENWREHWEKILKAPEKLERMDILRFIDDAQKSGNQNEAIWRAFLAGHFGRPSCSPASSNEVKSAGQFLCGFSTSPMWTWERVSSKPLDLRNWLSSHRTQLQALTFGNHRKYQSKKPDALFAVISSFLRWVKNRGGTPTQAFQINKSESPENNFNTLHEAMQYIYQFGRTGSFDTLCLMGEMGLISIRPGSCYLKGATGPLKGAKKLWGNFDEEKLTALADEMAQQLGVRIEVLEGGVSSVV